MDTQVTTSLRPPSREEPLLPMNILGVEELEDLENLLLD
jgi:hypothetical protein